MRTVKCYTTFLKCYLATLKFYFTILKVELYVSKVQHCVFPPLFLNVLILKTQFTNYAIRFQKQLRSFGYAWQGIRSYVGKEQNLSFHLIAMTAVTLAGFVLGITRTEWTVVILCFGVVIAAELFNTAIERLVDLVSPERHPVAGQVKNIAAGAVLVCAVAAAIIGLIIFIPYL